MTTALRPVTEREFQRQVVDLARLFGWDFIYHPFLSKWSEKGWPDLTLVRVRDRRLLFAELKTDKGRLTDRQADVLRMLDALGTDPAQQNGPRVEAWVWRPSDLERIAEVLR